MDTYIYILFIIFCILYIIYYIKFEKEKINYSYMKNLPETIDIPNENRSALELGRLVDERLSSSKDIVAFMMDLSIRGYLKYEKITKLIDGKPQDIHYLEKKENVNYTELLPIEKEVIDFMFKTRENGRVVSDTNKIELLSKIHEYYIVEKGSKKEYRYYVTELLGSINKYNSKKLYESFTKFSAQKLILFIMLFILLISVGVFTYQKYMQNNTTINIQNYKEYIFLIIISVALFSIIYRAAKPYINHLKTFINFTTILLFILLLISIGILIMAIIEGYSSLIFILAISLFCTIFQMSKLKDEYMIEREKWIVFREYIRKHSNVKNAELESIVILNKYLIFSIVLLDEEKISGSNIESPNLITEYFNNI